nr:hypothetical protein [Tanacetum cinerariifolium]
LGGTVTWGVGGVEWYCSGGVECTGEVCGGEGYFGGKSGFGKLDSGCKFGERAEKRMDESILWDKKCKSSIELFKIKRSVGTIFDGVERCKETIAKRIYFGHIDPFIQNTIEANFSPEIRKINADLEKFHVCLKEEMVADLRYFNSLELEVDSLKSQLETQKTQFLNEIDWHELYEATNL